MRGSKVLFGEVCRSEGIRTVEPLPRTIRPKLVHKTEFQNESICTKSVHSFRICQLMIEVIKYKTVCSTRERISLNITQNALTSLLLFPYSFRYDNVSLNYGATIHVRLPNDDLVDKLEAKIRAKALSLSD